MKNTTQFADRAETVLITGATSGIGLALAQWFAENRRGRGDTLLLVARSAERLAAVAQALRSNSASTSGSNSASTSGSNSDLTSGSNATPEAAADSGGLQVATFSCDLARSGAPERLMQQIHAAGYRVSILINNAGCGACGLFGSVPVAEHRQVICLGALALTELTHLCLPDLQACQGRILQLSSTGAFQPGPYTAVYYATKSYVHSFSLALAHELKPSGVSVSILCPGAVATGFSRTAGKRDVAGAMRPEQVAAYAAPRLMKRRKLLIPGLQNKLVIFFSKFLPGSWTAAMVAAIQKPLLNDQKGKGDS